MKNINDLTEDCMRHLFAKVPLQECIRLRLVCTYWCAIIQKICLGRKSLKLFGSISNIRTYPGLLSVFHIEDCEHLKLKPLGQDDDLIFRFGNLNKDPFDLLLKLFPNTTQLVVVFDVCLFRNLPYLLKCLSGRLEKVTMLGTIMGMSTLRTRAICDVFKLLRALKSLELYCYDIDGYNDFYGAPISTVVLQRLEHLALRNYSFGLIPHLTGNRFKSLTIFGWNRINLTLFAQELNANSSLTERLTQLCFDCVDQEFLRFICNHFTVLKHLDIIFKRSDMKFNLEMAKDLSRLSQLEDLRLQSVQLDINCYDSKPPQIGTVTELYILDVYGTYSKDKFDCKQFCLVFSLLFPNVTKLEVKVGSEDKVTELKQHLPNYFEYIRKPQVYVSKRAYLGRHKDEF